MPQMVRSRANAMIPEATTCLLVLRIVLQVWKRLVVMPCTLKSLSTYSHMHPVLTLSLFQPYVPGSGKPPPVRIRGEEEYELEAVTNFNLLKCERKNANAEFEMNLKVQWKGRRANTWQHPVF
jgi:hypothetical protein